MFVSYVKNDLIFSLLFTMISMPDHIFLPMCFMLMQVMSTLVQAATRPRPLASSVPLAPRLCEDPEFHGEAQSSLEVAGRWRRADGRS